MWIKAAVNYLRYYTSIHLEIIRKPTGNLAICRPRSPNRALTHTKQRYQLLNQVIHFLKGIIGRPHYCKPLVVAQVYQEEKKKKKAARINFWATFKEGIGFRSTFLRHRDLRLSAPRNFDSCCGVI